MDELVAGRFRLLRPLTRGAMGAVYEAEDLELGRRVALKLLGESADPRRFEREATTFAALDHPRIVRLFDVGEIDGRRFLVLELVTGGTLEDRLAREAPLEDATTARLAAQIASALAHAHARGIVHRDLKPANVLLDEAGDVRLGDFGIAAAQDAPTLTDTGTVLGTASYMAPEQARGEKTTARTDVYAFGVILYRMLTGRLPFTGDDAMEVARKHVEEEPLPVTTLRPDAPADLARLATSALAKHPEERPADGSALVAALEGAEQAQTLVMGADAAPRARKPARLGTPIRRATGVALTVGLAVVLAAGFGIAALLADDPAPAKAPAGEIQPRDDATKRNFARSTPPGTRTRTGTSSPTASETTVPSPTTLVPAAAPTSTRHATNASVTTTEPEPEPEPEPATSEESPPTETTTSAPEPTTTAETSTTATVPADG